MQKVPLGLTCKVPEGRQEGSPSDPVHSRSIQQPVDRLAVEMKEYTRTANSLEGLRRFYGEAEATQMRGSL